VEPDILNFMNYLYHRVHQDMRGDILYPLNLLKDKFPDIYTEKKQKYDGREHLLDIQVTPLNCLWNDVLHFSPIHPKDLKEALLESGRKKEFNMQFYQIDDDSLESEKTTIYLYPNIIKNFKVFSEDFTEYSPSKISECSSIPDKTKQYYRETYQQDGKPFLYAGIPHVLYKGTLDISNAPIVSV
jgi:hypothetical protein